MPTKNAELFVEHLCNDSAFRAKFRSAGAGRLNDVMEFAASQNYIFTEQDLKATLANYPSHPMIDELRDKLRIARVARR